MPAVLVVSAMSSKSVRAFERIDWVVPPAGEAALRRALENMLSVDGWLRRCHLALAADGYGYPIGPKGCTARLLQVEPDDLDQDLTEEKVAERLCGAATTGASMAVVYRTATDNPMIEVLMRKALHARAQTPLEPRRRPGTWHGLEPPPAKPGRQGSGQGRSAARPPSALYVRPSVRRTP